MNTRILTRELSDGTIQYKPQKLCKFWRWTWWWGIDNDGGMSGTACVWTEDLKVCQEVIDNYLKYSSAKINGYIEYPEEK